MGEALSFALSGSLLLGAIAALAYVVIDGINHGDWKR